MGHGTGGADQAAWDLPGLAGGSSTQPCPPPTRSSSLSARLTWDSQLSSPAGLRNALLYVDAASTHRFRVTPRTVTGDRVRVAQTRKVPARSAWRAAPGPAQGAAQGEQ